MEVLAPALSIEEAARAALADRRVVLLGEGLDPQSERVRSAPEDALAGLGLGLALHGLRPVLRFRDRGCLQAGLTAIALAAAEVRLARALDLPLVVLAPPGPLEARRWPELAIVRPARERYTRALLEATWSRGPVVLVAPGGS